MFAHEPSIPSYYNIPRSMPRNIPSSIPRIRLNTTLGAGGGAVATWPHDGGVRMPNQAPLEFISLVS